MENYDPQMADRVWQRVRSEAPVPAEGLGHLILCEAQAAVDYGKLQRRFPECKTLREEALKNFACLQGIHYLITGRRHTGITGKPREEPLDTLLRRCCAQNLKTAAEYRSRGEDPEYGCIYAQLADAKHRHCRVLLELIGRADKTYSHK